MSALPLNQRLTLTMPQGTISDAGKSLITSFITSQKVQEGEWKELNPESKWYTIPGLPEDWSWSWVVTGKGDYVGTFPKRFSKYLFKTMSLKCPTSILTEIGNLAKMHSSDEITYVFEFVDHADWYAGEFGDHGSCWWGDYSDGKDAYIANGGHAIRFYEGNKGIGRAWVMPLDENKYILFNGYGLAANPTLTMTRIMSQYLGMTYKRISVYANDSIYINGNSGYVIGEHDAIEDEGYYEFEIEVTGYRCENCNSRISEYEGYTAPNGETYCETCFYDNCGSCAHCDETHWNDDLTYTNDNDYCEHCLNELFTECHKCHDYRRNEDVTEVEGEYYCDDCLTDIFELCEECEEWKRIGTLIDMKSGERICNECRVSGEDEDEETPEE